MTHEPDREPIRRALLAEALETAQGIPGPDRERVLAEVAAYAGRHLAPARGLAVVEEIGSPLWRAVACAALARVAPGARVRAALRRAAKALAEEGAPPAEAEGYLGDVVERVLEAGEPALARRLCARFPGEPGAVGRLLGALLEAGHREEALELALRAPDAEERDGFLYTVACACAEEGDGEAALAAVERIGDRFTRERERLYVLYLLSGEDYSRRGDVAVREVRGALSALHALDASARQCMGSGDEEGARAFATAAARIAATAVDAEFRERALVLASRLQADARDVDGALATARLLPEGEPRAGALEYALWEMVPEDESVPVSPRAVLAPARGEEEREIAAAVIARAWLHRGDLSAARRWLRRVRSPGRRAVVLMGIGDLLLERFGDAAGAERALRHVPPDRRDDMTMRNLAIDQLRQGKRAGAAATLRGMTRGREWATWSLAGLAARYGQAGRVREWAREHLDPVLRVNVLLGAVAYLDEPPPYDDPRMRVFQDG